MRQKQLKTTTQDTHHHDVTIKLLFTTIVNAREVDTLYCNVRVQAVVFSDFVVFTRDAIDVNGDVPTGNSRSDVSRTAACDLSRR